MQIELRNSYVKRKAIIDNFDQQAELYNKFPSNDDLENNYKEISAINEAISENNFVGNTDSVRNIIVEYTPPNSYKSLNPSVPDIARANQNELEKEFQVKETNIVDVQTEILRGQRNIEELKEELSAAESLNEWNAISDSMTHYESRVAENIKKQRVLEQGKRGAFGENNNC